LHKTVTKLGKSNKICLDDTKSHQFNSGNVAHTTYMSYKRQIDTVKT